MLGPAVWIVALLTQAGHDVPVPAPPRVADPRLAFEPIVREPQIVTPTGLAVDARGRVLDNVAQALTAQEFRDLVAFLLANR